MTGSLSVPPRLSIVRGNIVDQDVDAIVNAANSALSGGGGVDGAIHRAAGPRLVEASRRLGPCPAGGAVRTEGFELPARWVIHAVGPVWFGGDRGEDELLASAHRRSLELAAEVGVRTLAFPAISCGAYRFPVDRASRIAVGTILLFLSESELPEHVRIVCFDVGTERAFRRASAARSASDR